MYYKDNLTEQSARFRDKVSCEYKTLTTIFITVEENYVFFSTDSQPPILP